MDILSWILSKSFTKNIALGQGAVPIPGPRGFSAYQVAVQNGFTGTETEWLASLIGEGGLTTVPILVTNPIPGSGFKSGDTIPAGTSAEDIFKIVFNPVVPPTYLAPTLTLAGSTPLAREIGENITITLNPTFTQRDGGAITQYRLNKNGSNLFTGAAAIPQNDSLQLIENITYQAAADYGQGPIKNDSANQPHPDGRIPAGTVQSGTVVYIPQRRAFFGAMVDSVEPDDSAFIRALNQSLINPQNGSALEVNVPAGSGRTICFAYPASLRQPTSIRSDLLGNIPVASLQSKTISVTGANAYLPIDYRVYYVNSVSAFGIADTYTLTI